MVETILLVLVLAALGLIAAALVLCPNPVRRGRTGSETEWDDPVPVSTRTHPQAHTATPRSTRPPFGGPGDRTLFATAPSPESLDPAALPWMAPLAPHPERPPLPCDATDRPGPPDAGGGGTCSDSSSVADSGNASSGEP